LTPHIRAAASVGIGIPVVALAVLLGLGEPARGQVLQHAALVCRVRGDGPEAGRREIALDGTHVSLLFSHATATDDEGDEYDARPTHGRLQHGPAICCQASGRYSRRS